MPKQKEIRLKLDVSCCPNPGYGPDECMLVLDEACALRLRANMLFVAENEVRADKSRDEIDSVDFMCAAPFETIGAAEQFQESGIRLQCYSNMFCVTFFDDDGAEPYESECVSLEYLEAKMERKGWLEKKSHGKEENGKNQN